MVYMMLNATTTGDKKMIDDTRPSHWGRYDMEKRQQFKNEQEKWNKRPEAEAVRLLEEKTQEQMVANFSLAPKVTSNEIIAAVKCHEEQRSLLGHLKDNAYYPYYCKSECERCTKAKNTLHPNVLALIDVEVWKRDAAWMLSTKNKSMKDHPSFK